MELEADLCCSLLVRSQTARTSEARIYQEKNKRKKQANTHKLVFANTSSSFSTHFSQYDYFFINL